MGFELEKQVGIGLKFWGEEGASQRGGFGEHEMGDVFLLEGAQGSAGWG
jgi:hypothetical protein